MIQTKSDLRGWLYLALALWTFTPSYAGPEDAITVELKTVVSVQVTDEDKPETIAERMGELEERLEVEAPEAKGYWRRKFEEVKAKYNYVQRLRVGRREVNAAQGELRQIPVGAVVFNGAAALIGIHILESAAIGPGFILLGNTPGLPSVIANGLKIWGAALINPIPTGVPFIDFATESFCWLTLVVVKTDLYHRGVYWIEMSLVKLGGTLGKLIGLDRVWRALMERQSGVDRLREAFERGGRDKFVFRTEDLSFEIPRLARLKVGITEKNEVKLISFERLPLADTREGRAELKMRLKVFGSDIQDAILNPRQLVEGGHGTETQESMYETKGSSVLLRSHWVVKPGISDKTCRLVVSALSSGAGLYP